MNLVTCNSCGFAFNRSFDPRLAEIGARYESSQAASAHFGAFAKSLARDWIERYELTGKTVLEVGCGGGDFLRQLLDGGVATAIGIDPTLSGNDVEDPARHLRLIPETFDERYLDLQADALVCRHTLEHIQDVRGFLRLLHTWALRDPRRVMLFEIPGSERVFAERAFWDVYYEHCNYFTATTARLAFELAGFDVLKISPAYDGQYLIIEAIARRSAEPSQARSDSTTAQAICQEFGSSVRRSIERCETALGQLAAQGSPIILWQGASKTVGFLSVLHTRDCIGGAIDLSPHRQGKFLPGSGLAVYAPAELLRLRPQHVILMNPVYLHEVRALVRELGLALQVHPVNALLNEDVAALQRTGDSGSRRLPIS